MPEGTADEEMDFVAQLSWLVHDSALRTDRKRAILRSMAQASEESDHLVSCRVVPFVPGRRPTDELAHPGLGSSDCAAIRTGGDPDANRAIVLFEVGPASGALSVDATVRFGDRGGLLLGEPLPGWNCRNIPIDGIGQRTRHRVEILPEVDIPAGECGFVHGFLRRALVSVRATLDGVPVAGDRVWLDVCDVNNLGSLYSRVIQRIVGPDTTRQAAAADVADPGAAFHPWFPVLTIGADKAALYTSALVSDIVAKERHLSDPTWLLRVGVYLELLTCIGIFEAVRHDLGDVLTPDERDAFENSEAYREIRDHLNVDGWRRIWEMRKIAFPRRGIPRAGPVSSMNLIQKKRATLEFLHVHHDDLKQAIRLAGPNHHNAQETWQRVFRDAERAVLRKTNEAFPELQFLPTAMRDVVLWQQNGVAGQQGLYPTAVTQYRESMNMVASWAQQRGLMDHTGQECIPLRTSLLDATMNNPPRVAVLQRGDGYPDEIDLDAPAAATGRSRDEPTTADFEALLSEVAILQMLSPDDLRELAIAARPVLLMPEERVVIQDTEGDSLFVVADGVVEVIRRRDGADTSLDTMGRGAVFGEMALLTGQNRQATVRAVDSALLFELGRQQYEPLLRRHPEWLDELSEMMEDRQRHARIRLEEHDRSQGSIRDRIRQRFLSPDH